MALATKCPHCNTIFRVAADQLKLRGGIVRCGSCHQVFDGNSALVEPAAKPTPVIPDVVAERAAPAHTIPAISDYVHGTPVDFELDFADEAAHAAPAPATDVPTPAVWRTSAAHAPSSEPSPDDAARAAVARAFASATTPPPAPQTAPPQAPPRVPEPSPAAPHPLADLVSPDDAFSEAAGEPPTAGPWTPATHPPAGHAALPAAAPSTAIDEKLLVWEDIPANASAASDAAAMAAVARAFNHVKNNGDEKKAPAPAQEFVLDASEPALTFKSPPPAVEAPPSVDDVPSTTAEPSDADVLPAAVELPVVDESPTTEELSAAVELSTTDEPPVVEELPVANELPTAEVSPGAAELPVIDEPPVADEPPTANELPIAEELPAAEEPPIGNEMPAADALLAVDAPPTADEPPIAGELAADNELPVAEQLPAVDALPADDVTTMAAPAPQEPAHDAEVSALEAEAEPAAPAGAAPIEAMDQWSANNAHPDGRVEPSFDIPQEHIVLAAIDDAHHFEDLPPAELPQEEPFASDFNANVEAEANEAAGADADAEASITDTSEPSLAEEPWPAAEDAADALAPTGEPWSLSEPEQERDDTALHAVAAVNTDVPDDGESLPSDEEQAAAEAALAAARMRALAGIDEEENLDHSDLSFVKRVDRSQKYGKAATVSMAIGIPLLLAGLALQAGTTFRDTLAANYPQLKPALATMCQPLGCKIALPTRLDALSVEQGELVTMAEGTFSYTTMVRNQSKTAQAWPHLELTLTDNADKPVLRRVFAPREYLPSPAEAEKGFGPRSEQSIKLYFELKQLKASGYHIAIFYP